MIDKNVKNRVEDIDNSLFVKNDINGNAMYFLDANFSIAFEGEIYSVFINQIESEAQYKNASKNGLEYIYNANQEIEQINECRGNLIFGVSKEFQDNKLKYVSVVYNNNHLLVVEILEESKVYKLLKYQTEQLDENLPIYLQNLLDLPIENLIDYEFQIDNPNLYL